MNSEIDTLALRLTSDAAAAALLQSQLPGFVDGPWRIASCRVAQCRRRISRRFLESDEPWIGVLWRLEVEDLAARRTGVQWLYGKAYAGGRSAGAWLEAQREACARPRFGTPVEHLAALDMVVWALPNDPGLPQLPAFLDSVAAAAHLPPAVSPDAGVQVHAAIVQHEPEKHCTARFETLHGGRPVSFYGKCYCEEERWRDARDGLLALWRQSCADPQAFLIGEPLGSSEPLRSVWQRELLGEPLAQRLAGAHADDTLAVLAGALLRFQAEGPAHGRREDIAATLRDARKWRRKMVLAEPGLAAACDLVLARLDEAPPAHARLVPVHGDFHCEQMVWREGRIALFDYDNLELGSPTRDLADFVSQLLTREIEPKPNTQWIARSLLAHYARQAGSAIDAADFEWQIRHMLMRKAYRAFVRNRAGWQARSRRSLARAARGLEGLSLAHCEALT